MRPRWTGPQQDLVEAEARDAQLAAERAGSAPRCRGRAREADAGLHGSDHAWMPTQVSASAGVRPPWWPLKRSSGLGIGRQPDHPARARAARRRRRAAPAAAGPTSVKSSAARQHLRPLAEPLRQLARRPSRDRRRAGSSRAPSPAGLLRQVLGSSARSRRGSRSRSTSIWPWSAVTSGERVADGHQRVQRAAAPPASNSLRSTGRGDARRRRSRPSRGTSARGAVRAAPRPPRSSRTAGSSRRRGPPSCTACRRSPRAAAPSRHVERRRRRPGNSSCGVDRQRVVAVARARTAAAGPPRPTSGS